jgi:hypothetical protein
MKIRTAIQEWSGESRDSVESELAHAESPSPAAEDAGISMEAEP